MSPGNVRRDGEAGDRDEHAVELAEQRQGDSRPESARVGEIGQAQDQPDERVQEPERHREGRGKLEKSHGLARRGPRRGSSKNPKERIDDTGPSINSR